MADVLLEKVFLIIGGLRSPLESTVAITRLLILPAKCAIKQLARGNFVGKIMEMIITQGLILGWISWKWINDE